MLILTGLGLYSEKDLTLKGLEEAKSADKVFAEFYTGVWHGNFKRIEELIDKKIEILSRKDLEEKSSEILKIAKNKKIAIFVQGDPLIATAHNALLSQARKLGIKVKVIHNASIISAVCETGLHIQKFGPLVTIPFVERTKRVLPKSIYNTIKENKKRGLHTLCLLDIIAEENKFMKVDEAINILLQLEKKIKGKIFTKNAKIIVLTRIGSDEPSIMYGKVEDLVKKDFGKPPYVLIIPGKLHFTEKECLKFFSQGN
jgi:diphthine synthase